MKPRSNPFEKPYHRVQQARDKSALEENKRRVIEYEKNLGAQAERMMDLQNVIAHLSKPRPEDVEPYYETRVPQPKNREQLCKDFFRCNSWDVEPVLLDELMAARESHDEKRIDEIRQIIRASSWMKHERTDSKVALEKTKEKAELFHQDHSMRHAMLTESGLEKEAEKIDPDLNGIKEVLEAIDGFHAIGKDAEPAIRYVEGALEHDWEEFLNALKEEQQPWPENPGVKLEGKTADLSERIKAWRMIRDQLYFQRYEVNLSKIGKLHSEAAE
ncbi:hypothetical protein K8R04_01700 [Candidatus Uhrbacteria bacterium]|nr:hypothetical protein [Candidatus Uhrbacteria bacterium]